MLYLLAVLVSLTVSAPSAAPQAPPQDPQKPIQAPDRIIRRLDLVTQDVVVRDNSGLFAADLKKWLSIAEEYRAGRAPYHATMPTDSLHQLRDTLEETRAFCRMIGRPETLVIDLVRLWDRTFEVPYFQVRARLKALCLRALDEVRGARRAGLADLAASAFDQPGSVTAARPRVL